MSSSNSSADSPDSELQAQWTNPGDILSLLLLIGGDIVQKALAQYVGVYIQPFKNGPRLFLTPVAFSFGWAAYAFQSLMSVVGDNQLMPDKPDCQSIVVNCSNAYVRENDSWILGRILRDHESRYEVDKSQESIRIDIFETTGKDERPDIDAKWIFGWVVIVLQQVLAAAPWIRYGDWGCSLVTLCGTIGALITGALPQWSNEKWASRKLDKKKIVALTRGNGRHHIMIFVNEKGVSGWDLEAIASAAGEGRVETRWMCGLLVIWWTLLLITVSGLKSHSWFLIGVGGVGMLQNIYFAGSKRQAGAFNIHYKPHPTHPTIIGRRLKGKPSDVPLSDLFPDDKNFHPATEKIGGVMGALMELESLYPKVGASLVTVFFPGSLTYDNGRFKFKWEKEFWKKSMPPVMGVVSES
jgi:hypothetical protein